VAEAVPANGPVAPGTAAEALPAAEAAGRAFGSAADPQPARSRAVADAVATVARTRRAALVGRSGRGAVVLFTPR